MAKAQDSYICQSCGAVYGKWAGRCDACGEWNTIVQETGGGGPPRGRTHSRKAQA